jgi:hypothetical protein
MQDARKQRRAEKDANLEAKQCQCGRWFTIRSRRDRTVCYRCEELLQRVPSGLDTPSSL